MMSSWTVHIDIPESNGRLSTLLAIGGTRIRVSNDYFTFKRLYKFNNDIWNAQGPLQYEDVTLPVWE